MSKFLDTEDAVYAVRFFPPGHAKRQLFEDKKNDEFEVVEEGNRFFLQNSAYPGIRETLVNKGDWIVERFDGEGEPYYGVMSDAAFSKRFLPLNTAKKKIAAFLEYRKRCIEKYGDKKEEHACTD
jgi:hypothetical protein